MQQGSHPPPPPPPPPAVQPPTRPQTAPAPRPVQQQPVSRPVAHKIPVKKKKKNWKKAVTALIILLILLAILFVPIAPGVTLGGKLADGLSNLFSPGSSEPAYADITMLRDIDVSVGGGGFIDFNLDIPKAGDITTEDNSPIQVVYDVTTNVPYQTVNKHGAEWMLWSESTSQNFIIQIMYEMRVYTTTWDIDGETSGYVDDIPQNLVNQYTGDEWKIRPSIPQIRTLADSLVESGDTVYDTVRAVYDYMVAEFTYETYSSSLPKNCTQTLADRSGDCDDQSILFCSLLRSQGIPAWLEFGVLYDPVDDEWGPHGWSKVYIPEAGGGGSVVTIDVVNSQFMLHDCRHVTEWTSDGNGDHLQDYYYSFNYTHNLPSPVVIYDETFSGTYSPSSTTIKIQSFIVASAKD